MRIFAVNILLLLLHLLVVCLTHTRFPSITWLPQTHKLGLISSQLSEGIIISLYSAPLCKLMGLSKNDDPHEFKYNV